MQSVFIRHNCSSTPLVLQQLWDRRLIALHYNDSFSTNPSDYDSAGRKALERLWRYCREGVIVGADYHRLNGAAMLVGQITKGSSVKPEEFHDPTTGDTFVYKTVALQGTIEVSYADFPLLVGVQPRQATITGWPAAEKVLEAALSHLPLPREPSCLHPSQLEVLCYEWLRETRNLDRLLMPIGRGLVDIDIVGINQNGNRVIAQVTHSISDSDLLNKQERLLQHARPEDKIYFFLPESAPLKPDSRVQTIDFNQVLNKLEASSSVSTKRMLSEMFVDRHSEQPHQLGLAIPLSSIASRLCGAMARTLRASPSVLRMIIRFLSRR